MDILPCDNYGHVYFGILSASRFGINNKWKRNGEIKGNFRDFSTSLQLYY